MPHETGPIDRSPRFLWAGSVYTSAGYHYGLHAHPFYHELVLVQQGRFRSRASGKEHIAVAGDILLYTIRTAHEEWAEDETPVLTWVCAFEWDGFGPDEPVYRRDTCGKIQNLLAQLTDVYLEVRLHGKSQPYISQCATLLDAVLAELKGLEPHGPHAMVDQVRAFIRSRIAEPLRVEDLAAAVGLSRSHFSRQYTALTGQTPREDMMRIRVEEARRLILTTSLPLKTIAPQVGISDEYHLSHLIKEYLGIGARELRQSAR